MWDRTGLPRLTGTRYPNRGVPLPNMVPFAQDVLGWTLSPSDRHVPREPVVPERRPAPARPAPPCTT